jgi:retinol-binding protein 3
MRSLPGFLLAASLLASSLSSSASETFDRKAVVSKVADLLEEMYVDPKTGKTLADHLRKRQAEGAFDACAAPAALADAVTRAMREVADDKHLYVRYGEDPAFPSSAMRIQRSAPEATDPVPPGGVRRIVATPEDSPPPPGATRRVISAPGEGTHPPVEAGPARSGVARVERLDGNVGYLVLSGFFPGDRQREAIASAMNVLEDTDALVVDVSRCPGGTPGAVSLLASYFFAEGGKELLTRYDRPMDRTDREYTLKEVPGKRRPDVPLYIVAGPSTGSACESFAYILQKHGRATVVGSRTAGAGYNNVLLPAGDGFTASISVARPIHPKTGRGWEGTGVEPDMPAAADRALSAAHREALQALLARAVPERRRAIEWALQGARARENGLTESAAALEASAGRYGAREIRVSNGALYYRSAGGRAYGPLQPVGGGSFLAGEDFKLSFERGPDGAVSVLSVERPDGSTERFARRTSEPQPDAPCASEKGGRP